MLFRSFEQQNKRSSITGTPPRVPIPLPNHTTDSRKSAAGDMQKEPLDLGSGDKPKGDKQQLIDKGSNALNSAGASTAESTHPNIPNTKPPLTTEMSPPSATRTQAGSSGTPLKSPASAQQKKDARLSASQTSPSKTASPSMSRATSHPATKPLKAQNTGQSATSKIGRAHV